MQENKVNEEIKNSKIENNENVENVENMKNVETENIENDENIANKIEAEINDLAEEEANNKLSEEELFIQALEKVRTESRETHDKFVRLSAEFVNYKNRVEKEKLEIIKYAGKEIMKGLLPFIDTLDSALNAEHKNLEECLKGFDLVQQSLVELLKKEGLEKINVEGEKFNPEYHEAMGFDNVPDLDDNIITCELMAGYKLKDKVLRHAMVKINKKS